jgi:hypothetical protein
VREDAVEKYKGIARRFLVMEGWFNQSHREDQNDLVEKLAKQIHDTVEDFIDSKGEL